MLTSINITNCSQDMDRFHDKEHLKNFYKKLGIDGMEMMPVGDLSVPEKMDEQDIIGVHLSFLPYWYDFWKENTGKLNKIFDNEENWISCYGSSEKDVLLERLRRELDLAEKIHARYVVFHVSESAPDECLTFQMNHTDEEICDAAAEIINAVLDEKDYSFDFLCENLWWSGLTMTSPEVTERLMNAIHYEKKGIMLDTGHLLHTNHKLRTQDEAVDYINEILNQHGELCKYIKGIHLNQSLSGEYIEKYLENPPDLQKNYMDKMMMVYPHIFKIDCHKPFTSDKVPGLIEKISPEFLTFELITENNDVHEEYLIEQLRVFGKNGGRK